MQTLVDETKQQEYKKHQYGLIKKHFFIHIFKTIEFIVMKFLGFPYKSLEAAKRCIYQVSVTKCSIKAEKR